MRSIAYYFLEFIFITSCLSCDLESVEDTSGCDFDSLLLVNPQTGFTVADENCGLEVDKRTFEDQPYVFYPNARDDLKYTLIMVDQDDPFTEDDNDFLQWMVINISGTSLKYGVGEFYGETLVAYISPDPAEDTCTHRYTIYIFEQIFSPLTFPELPDLRSEFKINDFIENVVPKGAFCGPVASIQFQSRF
ncbi:unnamed protein product [Chironomus riparius]|uniref:Phosphatidylethanolamine-binding protein n=1 Tax=Chironomus riparius TaxID=315576 RepID=A0A9N9RWP6_9DIPT|nr:unnamed protein product [Chironomus riparius]